jgi:Na+/proline symporter
MLYLLIAILLGITLVSFFLAPRVQTADGFFKGLSATGAGPSLWTLVLSQVTTWIFARSLITAAILGYYYGIAGALAYAAYYISFLTGGAIIDHLRFKHNKQNIQTFMREQFGAIGDHCYNVVIILRLLSEVFSNLLVVIIAFGVVGEVAYIQAVTDNIFFGGNNIVDYTPAILMLITAVITFSYSSLGGLNASLRTDVFQAILVILALAMLFGIMLFHSDFSLSQVIFSSPNIQSPGWALLAVAFLQVWSYPLHDPVMMDRGFLADRDTTKKSFQYAAVISIICILVFALLGVFAGVVKVSGEDLISTLTRLFGVPYMIIFNVALVISAVSTLDSTFASAAKLVAVDMNIMKPTLANGRWVMLVFLIGGGLFLFTGSKDLYDAVAVSGTVSMFLAPVIFFNIWGNQRTNKWALIVSFISAVLGGVLYLLESSGYTNLLTTWFGYEHKYSKLLIICISILVIGCISFYLGKKKNA